MLDFTVSDLFVIDSSDIFRQCNKGESQPLSATVRPYVSFVNVIAYAAYNSSTRNEHARSLPQRFFPWRIIGTPGAPGIRGMERGCRQRSEQARFHVRSGETKLSHCVLIHRAARLPDSCGLQLQHAMVQS